MIIYDIEIKKAIPDKNGNRAEGVEYCEGWHDHANMGIACVGVYDYGQDRYRVFMDDNLADFFSLLNKKTILVGFNSIAFDNQVIRHAGYEIDPNRCYDLLMEVWRGAGLNPQFAYPSHIGFGLDACCQINFGTNKTGNGALAPVDFQRKRYGSVIDYCLNDVRLTKQLMDRVMQIGGIRDPRDGSQFIRMRQPL